MTTRSRALLLGTLLPLIVMGATAAMLLAWLPRLPDPTVLHWGPGGPDRFGTARDAFLTFAVLAGVLCLPLVIAAPLVRRGVRRGVAALAAGVTVLVAGIAISTTVIQVDVDDARAVGSPGAGIAISFVGALLTSLLVVAMIGREPAQPTSASVPADAARLSLPDGVAAAWSRPLALVPTAVPVVVVALLIGLAVALGVVTGDWWMLVPMGLVSLLLVGSLGWRVTIDRGGLRIRNLLGWPSYRVPADEIVRADATTVDPLAEFGGWGVRYGRAGTVGFVGRKGEAIAVERTGGRRLVATVDDSARAAALLNTLVDRSRAAGTP
jgi:hypothetical protein